jgi:hypothetical protein
LAKNARAFSADARYDGAHVDRQELRSHVGRDWFSPTPPMFRRYFLIGFLSLLAGCATPPQIAPLTEPAAVTQQIAAEPVGDFFVGRRVYAPPFAIWGYIRSPRQSWRTAKLVILNEKYQFAPDRPRNQIGSDNGNEYRLYGYFSGDQIYDASSGRFCAEFVLKRSELISANPDPIWMAYFIRDRQMFMGWPRGGTQPKLP